MKIRTPHPVSIFSEENASHLWYSQHFTIPACEEKGALSQGQGQPRVPWGARTGRDPI